MAEMRNYLIDLVGKDHLGDPDVDGRIILKRMLKNTM
jgi:hypothetical protein